jgi:hypothetical protein
VTIDAVAVVLKNETEYLKLVVEFLPILSVRTSQICRSTAWAYQIHPVQSMPIAEQREFTSTSSRLASESFPT